MSYCDNGARGIPTRSVVWVGVAGELVIVRTTASGYVQFVDSEGALRLVHRFEFLRRYSPAYNRPRIRSQFSMCLSNLAEFNVYWHAASRKIIARSLYVQRAFYIPEGAQLLGVYAAPCDPDDFLSDLDSLIASDDHVAHMRTLMEANT